MKRMQSQVPPKVLALSVTLALGLAACGGGGGYVKPTPVAPATAPATTPSTPTTPTTPTAPPDGQPPADAQLALTDTNAAHAQGYTGAGVIIGVVDSGVMATHPALAGRVLEDLVYVDPSENNVNVDDVVGHGTMVAEIAAGVPIGQFAGGIAPGADIVSSRIIDDDAPDDNGSTAPAVVTPADAVPLQQVIADEITAHVKVMNNSWGGITWSASDTATTSGFDSVYSPFVNTAGGLVVFAAGNDSEANPSTIAALPSLAPALEKGWIAVVAVDSNNPTQLASYSNKCGIAANYCLAAPGDVIVSGANDTASNLTYYIASGTSLAAPQVSGAAALVWQAYPYFSNDLVRQTLLGTADDLGAPGVDPVFGYGELDVGKAVNGPMQFNWGDVTVSFVGNSSWNNPISGAGGLIKQGTGTLALTEPSSYSGLTQIQGGTLTAKSLAGDVTIGAAGTLDSTPAVHGSVTNQGVLAVHGGNTTVGGDYTQLSAGRLAVSLGSELQVGGAASLQGGDLYVIGTESGYVANTHTEVLSTGAGLTGTFSALDKASNVTLLDATMAYDSNTAWLDVTQVQATAVEGMTYTPASFGAAQRVDGAFAAINAQLAGAGAAATAVSAVPAGFVQGAATLQQATSVSAVAQSLNSLSGQLHAASAAMTFAAIDASTLALSGRFDALLNNQQTGGWAQSLGYGGGMSRSGFGSVGYDLGGWMVGQDHRVGATGVAGYAFTGAQWLGQLTGGADQERSNALAGMFYAGVLNGSWYSMGRLEVGNYRETMRREIQLGNDYAGVGSYSAGSYDVADGETGYRLGFAGVEITPYASLQYAQIDRGGFDESGADGFGLKADGQTTARWQASAGVRALHGWTTSGGSMFSVQAHALWQQSFGLRGEVFDASFSGINQFAPVAGIGLSRYGAVLGTTLQWQLNARVGLKLDYDDYTGQSAQGQTGQLSFNWAF